MFFLKFRFIYEYQELQRYIPLRSCPAIRAIYKGLQCLRKDELLVKHIMIFLL